MIFFITSLSLLQSPTQLITASRRTYHHFNFLQPYSHRLFSTGTRRSRGHGWFQNYLYGKGGHHLQGRYHARNRDRLIKLNNDVFSMGSQKTYFDISNVGQEDKPIRIIIELAATALPITCQNFIALCENGVYADTKVFKIDKKIGFFLGDITNNNGEGGLCHESFVEKQPFFQCTFSQEPLVLSHVQIGMISMLSQRFDRQDSRFLITTGGDLPQLDGRYVAFGRVKLGMNLLMDMMSHIYTKRGIPSIDVNIVKCGIL